MTNEEYLRVCGWIEYDRRDGLWSHSRHMIEDRERWFDTSEAVETQLAEDRARFEFVLSRTLPKAESLQDIDPGFFVDVASLRGKAAP